MKDANEMLVAGRGRELNTAVQQAQIIRPEDILQLSDLEAPATAVLKAGYPWPWQSFTRLTHGIRRGELYGLGAAEGAGKTTFLLEIIYNNIVNLDLPVGIFSFEQPPVETCRRLVGRHHEKLYHLPAEASDYDHELYCHQVAWWD